MRYLLTLFFCGFLFVSMAQFNWQNSEGGPAGGFWDMDIMNNKLYVSTGAIWEFDGVNWKLLNDYNNSLNAPNKSKCCVKAIEGKLYCGAKDFNTSGEGDIHYYDGSSWSLFQNVDFSYNGDYRIRAFEKYNGSIYMAGKFRLPTDLSYYGLAKWDGSEWVNAGKSFAFNYSGTSSPYEIFEMKTMNNDLYVTDRNNIWKYDGVQWDSLFKDPTVTPLKFPIGQASSMVVYNNELYITGTMHLSMSELNLKLIKYDGTTFSTVNGGAGLENIYDNIGRLNLVNNQILFAAHKISDNNTYLVSYNGSSFNELTKLADYGDWQFAKGYEYTNYSRFIYYEGNLWVGGNFQKIGGKNLQGLAYVPYTFNTGTGSITQPASMSSFTPGNNVQFSWSVDNVTSVALEYSENNGTTWNTIINNLSASNQKIVAINGQYTWTVPTISSPSIIVRLKDQDSGAELSRSQFTILNTTGITDKYLFDFRIFPNPSHGSVFINGSDMYEISVLNSLGVEVYSDFVKGNSNLNFETLPKGIYTCRIRQNSDIVVERLILE